VFGAQVKFADSLKDSRKDIDDSARQRADYDVKLVRLAEDMAEYRRLFVCSLALCIKAYMCFQLRNHIGRS
jgi:hypothetical protein